MSDALFSLDEKLLKQISFSDEKQIERLEKSFKELGQRVVTTNIFITEKFDDVRKMLRQYDEKMQGVATMDKV